MHWILHGYRSCKNGINVYWEEIVGLNKPTSMLFIISILKMEAVYSSETLISNYRSTLRYDPEDQLRLFTVVRTSNLIQRSLYTQPVLTLSISVFCPQSAFVGFTWFSEYKAIISLKQRLTFDCLWWGCFVFSLRYEITFKYYFYELRAWRAWSLRVLSGSEWNFILATHTNIVRAI
jgi:hypothetical protein